MGYLMGSLRMYFLREISGAELWYFFFFFLLLRQREKINFTKMYLFLHCIENWNFFPFGMKYLLFWEKERKAIEKEGDGCYCLSSTPRLLHHLARRWEHRFCFVPLCENVCEISRNKQVTYSPSLAALSQLLHALNTYE